MVNYRVIIEQDEDGGLIARVPDLPGCATEGKTKEELMANVKEVTKTYLKTLKKDGTPAPIEMARISPKL
jgi:predicted RNase H-like HicB family nuclease